MKCTHMQRLFCHHQHPVLCVSPHVLVHVQRRHRHVDPTGQELHLQMQQETFSRVHRLSSNADAKGERSRYLSRSFLLAEVDSEGEVHRRKHGLRLLGLRVTDQLPQTLVHHRVEERKVVPVDLQTRKRKPQYDFCDGEHSIQSYKLNLQYKYIDVKGGKKKLLHF